MAKKAKIKTKCPKCGAINDCTSDASCWCFSLPKTLPLKPDAICFCKTCLLAAIAESSKESSDG